MFGKTIVRCATAFLAAASLFTSPVEAKTWDERYFPNYVVYDQNGNSYRFYDDLIRDKIVVANFVYTTCTDICGLATARMAEVVEGIGDRMGKEIFVYSITLTPEIDTPETMKKFISAFGEVEGWKFLTGDPAEMKEIRWKLGERSRYLGEHRSDMVMGNDTKGYWRRISLMGNLDSVTEQILALDPEYARSRRNRVARLGDQRRHTISQRPPGEALFQKGCSGCHTIGGGDRIGPDLYGVTRERDRHWLERVLMEPDKLRKEGDPLFASIAAKYPNVLMPYLDLSKSDTGDVLSYIERRSTDERARRDAVRGGARAQNESAGGHDHAAHGHAHGDQGNTAQRTSQDAHHHAAHGDAHGDHGNVAQRTSQDAHDHAAHGDAHGDHGNAAQRTSQGAHDHAAHGEAHGDHGDPDG